jgi:hypothetical protein
MPTETASIPPLLAPQAPAGGFLYGVQPGTPRALPGFPHPELGCSWTGIGGQVFDTDGQPVKFLVVELGGTLGGQPVGQVTLTGSALAWGPGGYEFTLGQTPVESSGTLWLQFYNLNGNAVSGRIPLDTYNDCARNAILLNLVQVLNSHPLFFPFIFKRGPSGAGL